MTTRRRQATDNIEADVDSKKKSRLANEGKRRLSDGDDEEEKTDTQSADSKSTQTTRSVRGRTSLHILSVQRTLGIKKDVEFNEVGQPIGVVASQLQSYIGVLARDKVKITYDSWRSVPSDVKEFIWDTVKLSYNIDERWKGGCLSSANAKWRQFKAKLTSEYVYGRVDTPELNTPPVEYPFITACDWSAFVISRLTNNFKKLREAQQDRRSHNVHPYCLSRKGYARYAYENPSLIGDDPEINQAKLWIEGRKSKDGIHKGDDLIEKVAKIDEFISKKKSGTLIEGTILEGALERKEHRGRLRGVGGHVSSSAYFKLPRGRKTYTQFCSKQELELMEEKKRNAEQDARIAKLEAIVFQKTGLVEMEEKGSCSGKIKEETDAQTPQTKQEGIKFEMDEDNVDDMDDDVELLDDTAHFMGKLVALSLGSGTNVAGYGTVVKICGPNQELPENCMRVAIDEAVEENALLPIPTDDCNSIGEAVGSHVSWPKHLVRLREAEKPKKKKKTEKKQTVDLSTLPKALRVVYCYCKASLASGGNITVTLDDGVFGDERTLYVHMEDVEPFCRLQPIPYTCIAIYIWNLYNDLSRLDKLSKFRFVDPFNIGHIPCKKNDKKSSHEKMEQRARVLGQRLTGTLINQIVLVPVNVGEHWILTVIDPHKEEIGLLDPLYKGNHDGVWKQVVEFSLRMFTAEIQKKGKKTIPWTIIKGPKQPDCYQCGYFVMRYMRDIVMCDTFDTIDSLQLLFDKKTYSAADINEVRKEWADCVQEYIFE